MRAALDADARSGPEIERGVWHDPNDAFGRHLSAWLDEDAEHQVAEHLDEVLRVTARRRGSDRHGRASKGGSPWISRHASRRVPPVGGAAPDRTPARHGPRWSPRWWRLRSASRRSVLAPFGPARNGLWVSSADGDLFTVDPTTDAASAVDRRRRVRLRSAVFSRDGTQIVFLRSDGPTTEPAILTL